MGSNVIILRIATEIVDTMHRILQHRINET